jgi:hypothetical protein
MTRCFSPTPARQHLAGKAYQGRQKSQAFRFVFMGVHGQCRAQCVRRAVGIPWPANDRPVRRRGFTMLALGDLLTQVERKTPVVQIILNNDSLDFVKIEQQEAGIIPFGVEFKNPNFAKVAEAMGAKGIRIEEPGDVREGLPRHSRTRAAPSLSMRSSIRLRCRCRRMCPFHAAKGFTLSLAKQVLSGRMDSVIKTMERNVRLV